MNPLSLRFLRRAALVGAALPLLAVGTSSADELYARSRQYDLQNVRLDLRFDTAERKVMGEVTHTLAPLRETRVLSFDAVNLTVSSVTVAGQPAKFATADGRLSVTLDRPARAGERMDVRIRYEARPRQGMYFILPDKNYPKRPVQIWTQGETTETRHWIPIYDYPNDLTTSEAVLTVPRGWTTLSNGRLLGVRDAAGGMRTWHWRQSQPHATYLISVVVGEFDEARDTWRNIPVTYYVPRGQAERLRPTFERTPAMLEFFSQKFVPYPWDKYAQIAVEEHFGGMEHTSATTLTSGSLLHPELAGESRSGADGLVAHELFHQWYGDLVTCKDWANMWINEGFASYAEPLWLEHRFGSDDAAYSLWNSRNAWLNSQRAFTMPVVTRDIREVTENFSNIYGKAGWVVHMMRVELGNDDFFRAMKHFLTKHRHQNVVAADVAKAIEEATGRNMDLFFQQWIYGAGAPRFQVSHSYDEPAKQVKLEVKQAQKVEGAVGLFRVPVEVEITTAAGRASHRIEVSKASETFTLPADSAPLMVLFDKGNRVLKMLEFKKDWKELVYQLQHAETVPDRADAVRALGDVRDTPEVVAALGAAARSDRFWGIRTEALRALGRLGGPAAKKEIEAALANDEPWVRQTAVDQLARFRDDAELAAKLERIHREDKAWRVRNAALRALAQQKAPGAFDLLRAAVAAESPDNTLRNTALQAFGSLGDEKAVSILLEWAEPGKPFSLRSTAIFALGSLDRKNKDVTLKIATFLDEPHRGVQFPAVFALGNRGDAAAVAPLEAFLARNDSGDGGTYIGGIAQFARTQLNRLKGQSGQQQAAGGGAPSPGGPTAGANPAATPGADAATQRILQALEVLQRDTAELKESVKKLDERLKAIEKK